MWKLFKRNTNNTIVVEEPKLVFKNKTTNELIKEIHESFYTEVDKLLESTKILKLTDTKLEDLINKAEKLKSLGFINTKKCKEAQLEIDRLNIIKQENNSKKTLNEAINYFSQNYPLNKFITEKSVIKICNKYNLVYGKIDRYLGDVPDKNLKEISNFNVKKEDRCYQKTISYFSSFIVSENIKNNSYQEYIEETKDWLNDIIYDYKVHKSYSVASLEITALIKDFNMIGYELKDSKLSKIEIPNSVILQPVIYNNNKYYLIISAWGLEASDELLVNQKFN